MKTLKNSFSIAAVAAALTSTFAQQSAQPPESAQPATATQSALSETEAPVAPSPAPVTRVASETEKGMQFNFRGAPLETVLKYMSEAAGFVIIPEVRVEGRVDVWSYQPVTKDEAVDLLNTVLNKNGYAAIREDKVLTITTAEEAKKRGIPVKTIKVADSPTTIPKNDEMVTQIIQVRYANALQLTKDLTPLLADHSTLTANESGNALVLTDTQKNIRRMTEIVRALDTSISSISAIRVFPLMHADAKELATVVKDLFAAPTGANGGNNIQRGFRGIGGRGGRGGGFPGGFGGGAPGGGDPNAPQGTGVSEARDAASRVVAVADERTNSLVVSAPDEYIPAIEDLVAKIDTVVDDVTELQVFRLKYSSPLEMADELMQLFPDDTQSEAGNGGRGFGGGFRGFGGFGGGGRGGAAQQDTSERAKKMGKVTAVADERTGSLIVSASSQLMPQIAHMIEQLDADPARKQRVFVYSLENADADNVAAILQEMFQTTQNRNLNSQRNNSQNNNPLNNRNQFNQGTGGGGGGGGFGQRGN